LEPDPQISSATAPQASNGVMFNFSYKNIINPNQDLSVYGPYDLDFPRPGLSWHHKLSPAIEASLQHLIISVSFGLFRY
jgi:hypothetical protein